MFNVHYEITVAGRSNDECQRSMGMALLQQASKVISLNSTIDHRSCFLSVNLSTTPFLPVITTPTRAAPFGSRNSLEEIVVWTK